LSLCRARSLSPVKSGRMSDDRRASSLSPVGLHLAKPPRMGAWRGPIPRRRVTPAPVLGDFLACAKRSASGASVNSRPSELHHKSSSSAGQGSPALAAAAPSSSDRATVLRDRGRCWAASIDGPMFRWAGLGRVIQAAKHGRVLTLPRSEASIANLAVINAPAVAVTPSSSPFPTPPSSSTSSSPFAGHRSFAAVVANHRQRPLMVGAPPRPPSSSSTPAGAAL
jgi:hypothetical protein